MESVSTFLASASTVVEFTQSTIQKLKKPREENFEDIIESITSSAAIALLHFKPNGTKLRIENNKLVFDEPGYFQFSNRSHTSKEDLRDRRILQNAITKPQQWYSFNSTERNALIRIQKVTQQGLDKLIKTYKTHNSIVKYIEKYINKIEFFIKENEEDAKTTLLDDDLTRLMRSIWSEAKLVHLAELFETALKEENEALKADVIQEIHQFIDHRVIRFKSELDKDKNNRYFAKD